jgi:hypothetical protein
MVASAIATTVVPDPPLADQQETIVMLNLSVANRRVDDSHLGAPATSPGYARLSRGRRGHDQDELVELQWVE